MNVVLLWKQRKLKQMLLVLVPVLRLGLPLVLLHIYAFVPVQQTHFSNFLSP
jgi:hypothetical protein